MQPRLAFSALAAALAAVPALGQPAGQPWSIEGRLEDSDSEDSDRHRYDEHRLRLEAGGRYRISAESDDFDTRISLYRAGVTEPVGENDDFGGELDSRLNYAPAESGDYVLRVRAFSQEGRGAYSARSERLPPLPAPIASAPGSRPSTSWMVWEGELAATDADRDGAHFDDYLVRMRGGQTRLLAVESAAFDPLVWVVRRDGREGEPIEVDDDAGPGLNALLGFRPEVDGDYIVRVTSYAPGGAGAYRLRISEELIPPPPVPSEAPVEPVEPSEASAH